jgi:transposase-like protein
MPPTRRPYPPEFRSEAVCLARSSGQPVSRTAKDLGICHETLRQWVRQATIDEGKGEGLTARSAPSCANCAARIASCARSARS